MLAELGAGQTLVDLPYPETATAGPRRERGARVVDGLEVLVAQGAASFELWTGVAGAGRRHAARRRLAVVTLELTTAGESHGPALVAILTGLPAGPRPRAGRIDADLAPAPAGLRPQPSPAARAGRGRGARRAPARANARDAARARRREPRPRELGVGDEPVAARGRAEGQGHEAGDAATARARRSRGLAQVRARRTRGTRSSVRARGRRR